MVLRKIISVPLAAGRKTKAYMCNGNIYCLGVTMAICPAGRVLKRLNLTLPWDKTECVLIAPCAGEHESKHVVVAKLDVHADLPHSSWPTFDKLINALAEPSAVRPASYWTLPENHLRIA